jgi:hypothetical protein
MPLELAVELHNKYFNAELHKDYKIVGPAYSSLEGFKVSQHVTPAYDELGLTKASCLSPSHG